VPTYKNNFHKKFSWKHVSTGEPKCNYDLPKCANFSMKVREGREVGGRGR